MRAVVDTNVAISAAIKPNGPPAAIIRSRHRDAFTWVMSPALMAEMQQIFARPKVTRHFAWMAADVNAFFDALSRSAELVTPLASINVISDETDNRLLEAAVAGEADYVVSGDRAVLAIGRFEGISIVTPAQFLAVVEAARL